MADILTDHPLTQTREPKDSLPYVEQHDTHTSHTHRKGYPCSGTQMRLWIGDMVPFNFFFSAFEMENDSDTHGYIC